MNRKALTAGLILVALLLVSGCVSLQPKPKEDNFKTPVVTLDHVEVAHYFGWWYFSKKIEPAAGDAGNYGAPLDLAFVFSIENPNDYPVMMESCQFTVAFESFDLNTVSSIETMWIPPGKTNQVRIHAMMEGRQSLLNLLVTGGFKLKEKYGSSGAGPALKQLGEWWNEIPEFGFPIHVKQGSAVFDADGITKVAAFDATYP